MTISCRADGGRYAETSNRDVFHANGMEWRTDRIRKPCTMSLETGNAIHPPH
jgi:hypothetical protein